MLEMDGPACRFCGAILRTVILDLGMQPLAHAYVAAADLRRMEPFYPLRLSVCEECLLVQVEATVGRGAAPRADVPPEADRGLPHSRAYVEMAVERFALSGRSRVVEVGSRDGSLLQHLAERRIPVLGIEPAGAAARAAVAKGIPTVVASFGEAVARDLAAEGRQADLLIGTDVLARSAGLNDFVRGLKMLLKPQGVVAMEFPHVMRLIAEARFDTVCHAHVSYFSVGAVERIFAWHGLAVFDAEEIPARGGSVRVYGRHVADDTKPIEPRLARLKAREEAAGLTRIDGYLSLDDRVRAAKWRLLEFLIAAKRAGKTVVGYGAPLTGSTLLTYCGIGRDFLDYTVDRDPRTHGRFLPGSHIPIHHPGAVRETRPHYLLLLPPHSAEDAMREMACIREWGGQLVVPIPQVEVFP